MVGFFVLTRDKGERINLKKRKERALLGIGRQTCFEDMEIAEPKMVF